MRNNLDDIAYQAAFISSNSSNITKDGLNVWIAKPVSKNKNWMLDKIG